MSRGGGFGGARRDQLKGATWEYDATIQLESKPIEQFPPHPNLKRPAPFTESEMRQIKYYKDLQEKIHSGPLYTRPTKRNPDAPAKTFGEDQFNRQYGSNRKADMDPFHGVETYSMRFEKKKNDIPKLSGRPFNKELFPQELWSTLEGEEGEDVKRAINKAIGKKARGIDTLTNVNSKKLSEEEMRERLTLLQTQIEADENEEKIEEEVEVDSEFEDEEMGGDYDGEQYFDNGEDADEGDGYDGGGGDDY